MAPSIRLGDPSGNISLPPTKMSRVSCPFGCARLVIDDQTINEQKQHTQKRTRAATYAPDMLLAAKRDPGLVALLERTFAAFLVGGERRTTLPPMPRAQRGHGTCAGRAVGLHIDILEAGAGSLRRDLQK